MRRALALLVVISGAACLGSPTAPDVTPGAPFELTVGEATQLPDGARMRFDAVRSDSRCPIDALCITAGDAVVAISLNRSGGATESRELHTDRRGPPVVTGALTISLVELHPYPRSDRRIESSDYIARFIAE